MGLATLGAVLNCSEDAKTALRARTVLSQRCEPVIVFFINLETGSPGSGEAR